MKIFYINNFYNSGGSTLTALETSKAVDGPKFFLGCIDGELKFQFQTMGQCKLFKNTYKFDYPVYAIDDIIDDFQPDLIHIFMPGHENPQYFYQLPNDIPKYITVLCAQRIGFKPEIFNKVLFLSNFNKQYSDYIDNGVVVRPGLTDIDYQPNVIKNGKPIFGRISAFCPSKKIMHTVLCAEALREIQFVIAGQILDNNYFMNIVDYIEKKNITNIDLSINIDENTKNELLSKIDVLHYPTSEEAFCFSILEAMQRGKAVISYNNSGLPELNHYHNLSLVETGDIDNLIGITELFSKNKDLVEDSGKINREIYLKHYTNSRFYEDIRKVYN